MDRNKQVDIIRGGAILLVVLEHSLGISDNFFARTILSFHMPAFFILSGYLTYGKSTEGFTQIITRLRKLVIPQITLAILTFGYNFIIGNMILHTATITELNFFYCLFRWWFLLVMAQVIIVWEVLTRINKKHLFKAESIVLCICLIYMFLAPQGVSGPLFIAVTPVALGYYIGGNLWHRIKEQLEDKYVLINSTKVRIPCLLTGMILIVMLSQLNTPILMYANIYGNILISIAATILGYFVLSSTAMLMGQNSFLQWCGRNSIIIYVVHFCVVQGVRGILVRVVPLPLEILGWIVFAVAGLIVIIATKVSERYFGFVFGK